MRWRSVAQPERGDAGGVGRSGEGGPEGPGGRGGNKASGAGPEGLQQDMLCEAFKVEFGGRTVWGMDCSF